MFQLVFIGTKFQLFLELVVLLVDLVGLLLLSGELLLESADVVLLGEELALEGGDFFAGVVILLLFWLFVLSFRSMFGVFLFMFFSSAAVRRMCSSIAFRFSPSSARVAALRSRRARFASLASFAASLCPFPTPGFVALAGKLQRSLEAQGRRCHRLCGQTVVPRPGQTRSDFAVLHMHREP